MSAASSPNELSALARVAERASDAARAEILPRFRSAKSSLKADGTIVTEADLAAERAMRDVFAAETPEIGVLGEEYGGELGAGLSWVVDPIDGTISYARGIPLFGSLIALLDGGEPVLGLIDLPALNQRILGWRGGGITCDGQAVCCSRVESFEEAIVAHGDPYTFELAGETEAFTAMSRDIPKLRGYTDAFGHAMTLCGQVDAMVDLDLRLWDLAATRALVPEAGGRIALLDGSNGTQGLVMGSPALVEQLLPRFRASERNSQR